MTTLAVVRTYEIQAAHYLNGGVPERHKCRRPHGHRYVLEVEVSGLPDPDGIIVEYGELDVTIGPIVAMVDHHSLNDLHLRCSTTEAKLVSENPTCERLMAWFAERLHNLVPSIRSAQKLRIESMVLEEYSRGKVRWRNRLA